MPAQKSSSRSGTRSSSRAKKPRSSSASADAGATRGSSRTNASASSSDSVAGFVEQLINRVIKPLDLVLLTRERIQETLDEAAERGRVTRTDANALVAELVALGRQQTDDIFRDLEMLFERGRGQLESATRKARLSDPVERLVRSADRARRTVGVGTSFPILGYDDLTAGQVTERLKGLTPGELRKIREYERRHANRKSVLSAIEKSLA